MSSGPRGDDARPLEDATSASAATAPSDQSEGVDEEQASLDVMRLLSAHVPLTLLADLAQPTGPDSPDILEHEGLPDVAWWETADEEQQQH